MAPGRHTTFLVWLAIGVCPAVAISARAQSQAASTDSAVDHDAGKGDGSNQKSDAQPSFRSDQQPRGGISGRLVDPAGVGIAGARVSLKIEGKGATQDTLSRDDGQFAFADVPAGLFRITILASGFATRDISGNLGSGENYGVPRITLTIAPVMTEVRVVPTQVEVAQEQIKTEEKQRALGLVPNYFVSYEPEAAPLSAKQKFELAWKTIIDPANFGLIGVIAGVEQSQNDFSGYGQGAQGYAKRYAATYASTSSNTLIGSAILPAVFKQDPRYFYKGTGSTKSRIAYAIANAVICKGDNGRWQPNYSAVLGGLAAGGLSNLYYPAKDRNGVGLTFENALIGTAATAATNLLQEFLIRKLTPNVPGPDPVTGAKAPHSHPGRRMLGVFHHDGD